MGNLIGLFFILGGGLGFWGCCGIGRCEGFVGIRGVSYVLFDIYLVLSVRACGCLLHMFMQFWLQL